MARALPLWKSTDPEASLRASAPVVLVRLQELLDLADASRDMENIEALHDLRIAAKRLRYTLEIFLPTLDPEAASLMKTVEQIQSELGIIHDLDVRIPLLKKSLARERKREEKKHTHPAAEVGLLPLIEATEAERTRRFEAFQTFWEGLTPDTFATELTRLVSGDDTILSE
ncbi:MAG: CHAD domain-containing protein [Armatimonas sp.]